MRIRNHTFHWITYAAITVLAAAAATAVYLLDSRATKAYEHEAILAEIRANTDKLSIIEWQMISIRSVDAELLADAESLKKDLTTLHQKEYLAHNEGEIERFFVTQSLYFQAMEEEFGMLAAGDVEKALAIDREQVDPLYDQLSDDIAIEAAALHDVYRRSRDFSFFGSTAIAVFSFALFTGILLRHNRREKSLLSLESKKTALARSEERFRSLAQSVPDAVISINSDGRIVFWNSSAEQVFGYTEEAAMGKPVTMIMPQRFRDRHSESLRLVIETEQPLASGKTVEHMGLKKDGSEFPMEISVSSWRAEGELYFTAIVRDLTMRREKNKRIESQKVDLEDKNVQIWALYEISAMINQEEDLQVLLDKVLDKIVDLDLFEIECKGGIFLVEEGKMRLAAHINGSREFIDCHENLRVGECLCGFAAESGQIIRSRDSREDKRHTIEYPGMTPHGHLIIPLNTGDKVVGVLYLYLPAGIEISTYDISLMNAVGNQLAAAITKDRLLEETGKQSFHDPLTGLANRNLMQVELKRNAARAKRSARPLSVLMLELDRFQDYNDSFGRAAGDNLLADVAGTLLEEIGEEDTAIRYGGEEFFIILPGSDSTVARKTAERIRRRVELEEYYQPGSVLPSRTTVSIGAASFSDAVSDSSMLVSRSQSALHRAKKLGGNRVEA